jgi:hypothetical protein
MPPAAETRETRAPRVVRPSGRPTASGLKRASAMLIIAALYATLLWLVFFRLKLIRWGWVTGTLGVLGQFLHGLSLTHDRGKQRPDRPASS